MAKSSVNLERCAVRTRGGGSAAFGKRSSTRETSSNREHDRIIHNWRRQWDWFPWAEGTKKLMMAIWTLGDVEQFATTVALERQTRFPIDEESNEPVDNYK